MPYCSVNGNRIYYEVSGEGFPLLLIHANPFDHRLWLYQIASFSILRWAYQSPEPALPSRTRAHRVKSGEKRGRHVKSILVRHTSNP